MRHSYFRTVDYLAKCAAQTKDSENAVFNFIAQYHEDHGYAPSHDDIQKGCNISYVYVKKLISQLAEQGRIEYGGRSRMIKPIK